MKEKDIKFALNQNRVEAIIMAVNHIKEVLQKDKIKLDDITECLDAYDACVISVYAIATIDAANFKALNENDRRIVINSFDSIISTIIGVQDKVRENLVKWNESAINNEKKHREAKARRREKAKVIARENKYAKMSREELIAELISKGG